jgi:ribosomal protein S18 acetylase RimI-like enzyme
MLKCKQKLPDGVSIFQLKAADSEKILQDACTIEKKSFPKHMSMTECLEREVRKPRAALLLARERDIPELAGFALVTWNGATGSIAKLVVRERSRRQGHGEKLMQVSS